jgi:hypothetical protein
MTKGYLEVLRVEIARKFELALEQQAKPVSDAERFKAKADRLIEQAIKATAR